MEKLKVLLVPYNEEPRVVEIDDHLEAKQKLVGGLIACIHVEDDPTGESGAGVDVWHNEEFLFEFPDQPNRHVIYAGEGPSVERMIRVHGPFFVARNDDAGDMLGLTDADVAKYSRIYRL